jgi:UTP--glucose-1-phosphate uridylyltransferase
MPIKKAIFVVAGFGTRFLPATKAQPKEMLPIVDKPIIQYLVEEAVEAGIKEIVFVTGRGKQSIENHFDTSFELERVLAQKGKTDLLNSVQKISNMANFAYVRQPQQKGDGHALLCAEPYIETDESVLVIFPDYLMHKSTKGIQNIIDIYNKYQQPVVCGDIVPDDQTHLYGVMDFDRIDDSGAVKVKGFVEKPKTNAPSNLISAGYFVITPEIIKLLQTTQSKHADGEIRIADALVDYLESNGELYAFQPEIGGYDCGTFLGFLKATVDFGLDKAELNGEFLSFLKSKVSRLSAP